MQGLRALLLCFFLVNLVVQSGCGWVCARCPVGAVEKPTCHAAPPPAQRSVLQQGCCCPASQCVAVPEYASLPSIAALGEPEKRTGEECFGIRLSAKSTFHLATPPLSDGPESVSSPPLFQLYHSYLI